MNTLARLAAAAGALALIAGCADTGPGVYAAGYGYDVAPVGWDGYYDNYYGPFFDGYWGTDGGYYYRLNAHDRWHRDTGNHFRRDAANGYRPVHGMADRARARDENRPRD